MKEIRALFIMSHSRIPLKFKSILIKRSLYEPFEGKSLGIKSLVLLNSQSDQPQNPFSNKVAKIGAGFISQRSIIWILFNKKFMERKPLKIAKQ